MSENQANEVNKIKVDADIWIRMMKRYAIAMVVGIAMLAYLFPNLHDSATMLMVAATIIGGLLVFGGGFGIAVSFFFYLWHKK